MNNSTVNAVLLNKKNILTKKNLHNQKKNVPLQQIFRIVENKHRK